MAAGSSIAIGKPASYLGIARNTLFKIRAGRAHMTPSLALSLAEAFDTTPQLWLNLQQKYDLWMEEHVKHHEPVMPIVKQGLFLLLPQNTALTKGATA